MDSGKRVAGASFEQVHMCLHEVYVLASVRIS